MLPKIADVISDFVAELVAVTLLAIGGWLLRHFLKRLCYTVIEWLARQWRYLAMVILLTLIEIALYIAYASWPIIVFSTAHLAFAVLATLLLFVAKRPTTVLPRFPDAQTTANLIQKIGFDYLPASPLIHGWKLGEGIPPRLTFVPYRLGKKALAIQEVAQPGQRPYALDYNVEPVAKIVEFVAKFESGAAIYAHVGMALSKPPSTSADGWIQFRIGTSHPERVTSTEWLMYVMPTRSKRKWDLFRIDLMDAVKQTLGNDGWTFKRLIGFRLRGNLKLAHISVFKS